MECWSDGAVVTHGDCEMKDATASSDAAVAADVPAAQSPEALFHDALAGVGIQLLGTGGTRLLPLIAERLSLDAKTRFAQLFAAKPQWGASEIAPYLAGVYAEGCKNVSELLLKFTRAVRESAEAPVVHCAR